MKNFQIRFGAASFKASSKIIENIGHTVLSLRRIELPEMIDGTTTFTISRTGKSHGSKAKTTPFGSNNIFLVTFSD